MNDDPNDPIEPSVGDETEAAAREIARLTAERDRIAAILRAAGFTPCSAAACNCGGWHGGHAEALRSRLRHVAQMLIEQVGAGGPMDAEAAAERTICVLMEREVQRDEARAERDRLAAEVARLTAERDALRCRAPVVITMDADDLRSEIGRMIGAAMPAEVNATVAERDALRTFAMRIAAACPVSGGEPLDLDHLAETVRRRLAGGAPVHRGPPHDWPPLINGDCEGGGEPEILCEACGEEGYHCYCGEGLCRYCGGDCGESGCHDVSDADEVSHG